MQVLVRKGTTERVYAPSVALGTPGAELETFRGEPCTLERVVVVAGGGTSGKVEVRMTGPGHESMPTRTFFAGVVGLEWIEADDA